MALKSSNWELSIYAIIIASCRASESLSSELYVPGSELTTEYNRWVYIRVYSLRLWASSGTGYVEILIGLRWAIFGWISIGWHYDKWHSWRERAELSKSTLKCHHRAVGWLSYALFHWDTIYYGRLTRWPPTQFSQFGPKSGKFIKLQISQKLLSQFQFFW